jgi:hypothetical protein
MRKLTIYFILTITFAGCELIDSPIDGLQPDTGSVRGAIYFPALTQGNTHCTVIYFIGGTNPTKEVESASSVNIEALGFNNIPAGAYDVRGEVYESTCAVKTNLVGWTATGMEPTVTVVNGDNTIVHLDFGWQ